MQIKMLDVKYFILDIYLLVRPKMAASPFLNPKNLVYYIRIKYQVFLYCLLVLVCWARNQYTQAVSVRLGLMDHV